MNQGVEQLVRRLRIGVCSSWLLLPPVFRVTRGGVISGGGLGGAEGLGFRALGLGFGA